MINSPDFVKRLEKVLKFYQLSAAAFAEEIDFNRSTISHLLSGRNKPSLEFVMKLLEKFPEVEMQWLLFGKGNFPSTLEKNIVFNSPISKSDESRDRSPNLFSEENNKSKNIDIISDTKRIDKIVIFFEDGSFKSYEN